MIDELGVEREVVRFVLEPAKKWGVQTGLSDALESLLEAMCFFRTALLGVTEEKRQRLRQELKTAFSAAWNARGGCRSRPGEWTRGCLAELNLQLRLKVEHEGMLVVRQ